MKKQQATTLMDVYLIVKQALIQLDYSAFPLWCGGLDVHIDDRQATQLLYHLVRNVLYSKNTSEELKKLLGSTELIEQANKFHRVEECGRIGGENA